MLTGFFLDLNRLSLRPRLARASSRSTAAPCSSLSLPSSASRYDFSRREALPRKRSIQKEGRQNADGNSGDEQMKRKRRTSFCCGRTMGQVSFGNRPADNFRKFRSTSPSSSSVLTSSPTWTSASACPVVVTSLRSSMLYPRWAAVRYTISSD